MMKWIAGVVVLFIGLNTFAQNTYQGSFFVEHKNASGDSYMMEVKVRDSLVYLKSTQGGIGKYDFFILNLNSRELFTVSQVDRKVILKYEVDKLLELYETEKLKPGFKRNPEISYKATSETKDVDGVKATKYVSETSGVNASFWLLNSSFNFNQLIPLLRLMNNWNDIQYSSGTIISGEMSLKGDKDKSSVRVVVGKATPAKELFELPKGYMVKDFAKVVEEEKKNKNLKGVIQAFAGF